MTKEIADDSKWSKTANLYVRYFEPTTLVVGRFLINCLKLQYQEKPLRILEAGCGTGKLAKDLLRLDGLTCSQLVIGDLADGMMEKAKECFRQDDTVPTTSTGCDEILRIEKADFTHFDYPDQSFDRYYSNLCLHYASDPDAVIREAERILAPGGIAGFTVWGRSEDSPMMSIVPAVLEEFGLREIDPTKRSSFHLGEDDEALREKILSRGFVKCSIIHFPAVFECFDASYFVEMIIEGAASTKKEVESFSQEDQKRVRDEVFKRANELLRNGTTMTLDIAAIICQK